MAKHLKLRRLCRVINSTFQSCRSKDPSVLPQDPAATNRHPYHRSSAFQSAGSDLTCSDPVPTAITREQDHFNRQSSSRGKICNSASPGGHDQTKHSFPPPLPPPTIEKQKTRRAKKNSKKKKKKNIPRTRLSTSSAESGWFSSGGDDRTEYPYEEETETLVSSSRSFSTDGDDDEYEHSSSTRREKRKSVQKKRSKRAVIPRPSAGAASADSETTPARLSVFKKLIPCTVDGKVKESFAVVKRSEDPYKDFKRSMAEMILEKQMFEERDLEQLLQCFLSLNSKQYHEVIIRAFSEIWDAIFCTDDQFSAASSGRRTIPGGGVWDDQ